MSHDITQKDVSVEQDDNRYLVFSLNNDLFAIPLLQATEVLKMTTIKPVPFMTRYFKGIINVRGSIVSILDLREKFNLPKRGNESSLILILKHQEQLLGAIVDDVIAVINVPKSEIMTEAKVEFQAPAQFLLGFFKKDTRLVTLIDVAGSLSSEDFRTIKSSLTA